jgi:hypothetical protein
LAIGESDPRHRGSHGSRLDPDGRRQAQESATFWGGFIPIRVGGVAGDESFAPVFLTPLTATLVMPG